MKYLAILAILTLSSCSRVGEEHKLRLQMDMFTTCLKYIPKDLPYAEAMDATSDCADWAVEIRKKLLNGE